MQYLLKVSLEKSPIWRLVAIDGMADRAFVGDLIALSFDYPVSLRKFVVNGEVISAGSKISDPKDLLSFDSLELKEQDKFSFICHFDEILEHRVDVLKCEEHLFCVMPSTLVGVGLINPDNALTLKNIVEYADKDDTPSLNLRDCTTRMRAYGVQRVDAHKALLNAGANPIKFNLE